MKVIFQSKFTMHACIVNECCKCWTFANRPINVYYEIFLSFWLYTMTLLIFIKIQNFDITMSVLKSIKFWQSSGQNTNNISLLHEDRSKLAALGHSEITPWSASKTLKFEEEGTTTFMSHFIEVTTAWSGVVYEVNLFVAFLVSRWSWCIPVHPWFVNYVSATLMYIE